MQDGYIKLYRSLLDSQAFQNEGLLKVWIWCLVRANYKERWLPVQVGKGFSEVHLMPGQFLFGRETASKELKMNPSSVRNRIEKLKSMGNLDIKPDSHFSIITVINWDKYQSNEFEEGQAEGQPEDRQRTGKGQAKDTDKKDKKEKKGKKTIKPMIPWPEDFTLTDHLRQLASKYIPADKIDDEWIAFKAWALSKNIESADWQASWTTRYVNYAKFNKADTPKRSDKDDDLLKEF